MTEPNGTKPLSLLEALGAKQYEIEIEGQSFPFYELTGEQVGLLIEKMEQAARAGVSVLDYFNKDTGKTEHFLKEDNWWRMAAEGRHFFFAVIAYSLHVSVEEAAQYAVKHYPALLRKAYEVSGDFFGEFGAMISGVMNKVPAIAAGIAAASSLRIGPKSSLLSNEDTG